MQIRYWQVKNPSDMGWEMGKKVKKRVRRIVVHHGKHHTKISYIIMAVAMCVFVVSLFVEMSHAYQELSILITAERLASLGMRA